MIDGCNALGAIVTCGGAGLLAGVSIGAWVWGRSTPDTDERARRKRLDAVRRLGVALDDLHGLPTPMDVRRARVTVEGVVAMLDDERAR